MELQRDSFKKLLFFNKSDDAYHQQKNCLSSTKMMVHFYDVPKSFLAVIIYLQVENWRHMIKNKADYNTSEKITLHTLACEERVMGRLKNNRG